MVQTTKIFTPLHGSFIEAIIPLEVPCEHRTNRFAATLSAELSTELRTRRCPTSPDAPRLPITLRPSYNSMTPYRATTEGIAITVRPVYLDRESDVMARRFVFAYFIRIENHTDEDVQLLRRHWFIREAGGDVQEVEGEGVVGEQPIINPGAAHEYNSYCILHAFEGTMEGSYLMERVSGERFRVTIPLFNLRAAAN